MLQTCFKDHCLTKIRDRSTGLHNYTNCFRNAKFHFNFNIICPANNYLAIKCLNFQSFFYINIKVISVTKGHPDGKILGKMSLFPQDASQRSRGLSEYEAAALLLEWVVALLGKSLHENIAVRVRLHVFHDLGDRFADRHTVDAGLHP
jgi:hypothetical protein